MTTIVWFRHDLRRADNPALTHAAATGAIIPAYILDEASPVRPPGGASRWWLHRSLEALAGDLGGLVLMRGDPLDSLVELAARAGARVVYWNRLYEPAAVARDTALKTGLEQRGIAVHSFAAGLLHEPWEIATGAGGPYQVFTPFWRACLAREVTAPVPAPEIALATAHMGGERLADWRLMPARPNWADGWDDIWSPGEAGAAASLDRFLADGLSGYAAGRDRPDLASVSRLSPHLHFGEISPRQVLSAVRFAADAAPRLRADADKFIAELGWREFAAHLLFHFPRLPDENLKSAFNTYPWRDSATDLERWQRGMTGYPLVDAGMRELWASGYMHNRVRMVAASFLVKHLRLHWKHGEEWFWDTLVDADAASNAASWQWVAGSGADAAPYFRIFNPVTQGRKFDPDGAYVRRWCPELAGLPDRFIHSPFDAPADALTEAGVRLGVDYPKPIVDHGKARRAALAGYEQVRQARASES